MVLELEHIGNASSPSIPNPQPPPVTIKWPNDILIRGLKIAGVLCESEITGGNWAYCAVGFGINVNLSAAELGDLKSTATSMSMELGRSIDRTALLSQVLHELDTLYISLQEGRFSAVFDEWAAALDTIGKRVSVLEPGGMLTGQALRVDRAGGLVIRLDSGDERQVLAGDVWG
jgi:BirA family biotin operon repressor/biotin-[acetyl-CoA-carboxylase] ligase